MARTTFTSNHKIGGGNLLTLALLLSMALSSFAKRHILRGAAHQARDLELGDSALFGLELVESENSNTLVIPGEDKQHYEPSYHYSGKGSKSMSKSTKSSKGMSCKCGSGKSKGSKSKKGGYEYCPCDGSYPPGYHPHPDPGDGGDNPGSDPGDGGGEHPDGGGDNAEGGGENPGGGSDNGDGTDNGGDDEDGDGTDNGGDEEDGSENEGVEGDHNGNGIPDIYEGENPDDPDEDPDGSDGERPASGGALNCDAIIAGTGTTWGQHVELNGELEAAYYPEDAEESEVLSFIYTVMNNYVRIWMAECELPSKRVAQEREDNANIINVVMEQTMKSISRGACDTDIPDAVCIQTDTLTRVFVGSGDTAYLAGNLNDAINRAVREGEFDGLSGLHSVSGPNGVTTETTADGDRDINSAQAAEDDDGLGVAAKVVIPVAALTLLLLGILFLIRRKRETTHVKGAGEDSLLDYDTDEETSANRARFVNDDDTLSSGPFDGMDDYNYNDSTLGQNHATMDVHICQSSLCEACERTDQHNGISFVKTGAPSSPERLPANSTRDYSTSDTVSL